MGIKSLLEQYKQQLRAVQQHCPDINNSPLFSKITSMADTIEAFDNAGTFKKIGMISKLQKVPDEIKKVEHQEPAGGLPIPTILEANSLVLAALYRKMLMDGLSVKQIPDDLKRKMQVSIDTLEKNIQSYCTSHLEQLTSGVKGALEGLGIQPPAQASSHAPRPVLTEHQDRQTVSFSEMARMKPPVTVEPIKAPSPEVAQEAKAAVEEPVEVSHYHVSRTSRGAIRGIIELSIPEEIWGKDVYIARTSADKGERMIYQKLLDDLFPVESARPTVKKSQHDDAIPSGVQQLLAAKPLNDEKLGLSLIELARNFYGNGFGASDLEKFDQLAQQYSRQKEQEAGIQKRMDTRDINIDDVLNRPLAPQTRGEAERPRSESHSSQGSSGSDGTRSTPSVSSENRLTIPDPPSTTMGNTAPPITPRSQSLQAFLTEAPKYSIDHKVQQVLGMTSAELSASESVTRQPHATSNRSNANEYGFPPIAVFNAEAPVNMALKRPMAKPPEDEDDSASNSAKSTAVQIPGQTVVAAAPSPVAQILTQTAEVTTPKPAAWKTALKWLGAGLVLAGAGAVAVGVLALTGGLGLPAAAAIAAAGVGGAGIIVGAWTLAQNPLTNWWKARKQQSQQVSAPAVASPPKPVTPGAAPTLAVNKVVAPAPTAFTKQAPASAVHSTKSGKSATNDAGAVSAKDGTYNNSLAFAPTTRQRKAVENTTVYEL